MCKALLRPPKSSVQQFVVEQQLLNKKPRIYSRGTKTFSRNVPK